MIWPGAEKILARAAAKHRIAYSLSTSATQDLETIGPLVDDMGWFQLYPPRDPAIGHDLLRRAAAAGFRNLLVTVDAQIDSRRERARRGGLRVPFRITLSMLRQVLARPAWAEAVLRHGVPRFRGLEPYWGRSSLVTMVNRAAKWAAGSLDWDYIRDVRDRWPGKVLVKGLLHPDDAEQAIAAGCSTVRHRPSLCSRRSSSGWERGWPWFSIAAIRGGLDIARAVALGADFVLLWRAFMYGVCALGNRGGDHTVTMLIDDLQNVMTQAGCRTLADLRRATLRRATE